MWTVIRDAIWEWMPEPLRTGLRVAQVVLGPVLFAGGFVWDALTLDRIDRWTDNALLGSYLVMLGVAMVLDHRAQQERLPKVLLKWPWLYGLAVHFFFGGLFSAYVVYYLKSATLGRTLGFLVLLAGMLVANEFLQRWVRGSFLRLHLFLLCGFSFLLFWIPVATGIMGPLVWIGSSAGSFVATALVFVAMDVSPSSFPKTMRRLIRQVRRRLSPESESPAVAAVVHASQPDEVSSPAEESQPDVEVERDLRLDRIERDPIARLRWQLEPAVRYGGTGLSWVGVLGVLLVLDLLGMIPPVPISVLHTGMYHQVDPGRDRVELAYENPGWWRFWVSDDSRWSLRPGDRVCHFAPVFAPSGVHPRLYHRWERWDEAKRSWQWTGDQGTWVQAKGGKDKGSPHFTCKRNGLKVGLWRVTVETDDQRVVSSHRFELVTAPEDQELELIHTEWTL
ncbi:MAG: hypothetical protein AB8H79_21340 [Myxococcota bacterium]